MIIDINSDAQALQQFLHLPDLVYDGDPNHQAPSKPAILPSMSQHRFRDCQRMLVAVENGKCVARIVAQLSPTLSDNTGRPYGVLGFFEALNQPATVHELFSEATDWLRQSGAGTIIGPMDCDTWHHYRLNVGPFDQPTFLMEPYNPPYYQELWEDFGFEPLEGYYSKHIENVSQAATTLDPILRRVWSRGYTFRTLDMSRFRNELEILYQLSVQSFDEEFLYEKISLDAFLAIYDQVKPLVDPDLVWFAKASDDNYVGFLFAIPDLLAQQRYVDTVNLKSLGVLSGHRRTGLGAALMGQVYQTILEKGYQKANLCLIRDGNPSGRLDGGQGTVSRRYTLYQYSTTESHDP